jgi:hypothetical protein
MYCPFRLALLKCPPRGVMWLLLEPHPAMKKMPATADMIATNRIRARFARMGETRVFIGEYSFYFLRMR